MVPVVCRQLWATSSGGLVIPYMRTRNKRIIQKRMSLKMGSAKNDFTCFLCFAKLGENF